MAVKCKTIKGREVCPKPNLFQSGFLGRQPFISFLPTDLIGLTLWLDDPNNPNNIIESSLRVSQWTDISGNSNHFIQSTGADQPLRTISNIGFDGASEFLDGSANFVNFNNNTGEWFLVHNDTSGAGVTARMLNFSEAATALNKFELTINSNDGFFVRKTVAGATTSSSTANSAMSRGGISLINISSSGTTYLLEQNGTAVAITSNDNGDWISDNANLDNLSMSAEIDTSPIFDINAFQSIVYYNRQLTTDERLNVRTFLNNRFNIF